MALIKRNAAKTLNEAPKRRRRSGQSSTTCRREISLFTTSIWGKGNIDHILICPKGIFTLETKSHTGKVSFDGEMLLRNGRPFEKDFLKQAWAQCYLVREILAKWGITSPLPDPVILFTKAFIEIRGKTKGIEIVGIKYFPKFLERFPEKISTPEAGRIYNRIKAASKG
jgi:hypothetical protein